jgi:hypothetical protein
MPQYRFNGTIKAVTFKDARVSVLLENTTFFSNEGDWKQWTDWELLKKGGYKKGDVWVSAFEQSAPEVFQACKVIEKGSEVEVEIFKTEKGFLNINNIQLKVPDVDVNADLKPPDEPSSDQRPKDSPEAEVERMLEKEPRPPDLKDLSRKELSELSQEELINRSVEEESRVEMKPVPSTTVDMTTKDVHIIRECCVKAVGSGMRLENENDAEVGVAIARRWEKYVLEGK